MPTVLIVDDHPAFRATARILLESEGYSVVGEAADAASAIAQAGRLLPDIVLLDVNLPDGDGFGVARSLVLAGNAASVVLVSSRDALDFGARIADSGARGFIAKAELSGATLRAVVAA